MATHQELDTRLHHKTRSKKRKGQLGKVMDSRRVANHTYLERRGTQIVVRLHETDVLTFTLDGKVTLNTDGWHTVTTKERINTYLPEGYYVHSVKGEWQLSYREETGSTVYSTWDTEQKYGYKEMKHTVLTPYADGLTIDTTNNSIGGIDVKMLELRRQVDQHLVKKIDRYLKGLTKEKWAKVVAEGSAGDCFLCTIGDAEREHLIQHLDERYYMVTLAYRAMQQSGYRMPEFMLNETGTVKRELRKYFKKYVLIGAHTGNIPQDVLNRWTKEAA